MAQFPTPEAVDSARSPASSVPTAQESELDVVVVIVSYKSARLTINSISSLQEERRTPGLRTRVIVVDNASGDSEPIAQAIAEHDWSPWVSLISAPRNGGFAYGNNLGFQQAYATGHPAYFYLLNPDTEVRAGVVGSLVRFLEAHREVGIAGSGIDNADGTEWPIAFRFPSLMSELSGGLEFGLASRLLQRWEVPQRMSRRAQPVDWVSGASMMIRSSLLAAIGGLDEHYFLYFEETDFCFRARQAGFPTWYVPEGRVMHLEGQSTQVNDRSSRRRRLPAYWFESRRRYFARSLGIRLAIAADIIAVLAHCLGTLKRIALGRARTAVPCFVRDLVRHSVVWPANRQLPPVRSFRP
jgi:N-acetylglucosaminyl-diphospho-decaprenol L-rhamnosyltransferase